MNRIVLLIFIGIIGKSFALNTQLIDLEENLLYSQLNNPTNLKGFYEKLLQSNGIEHFTNLRHRITNEDIQQQAFLDKVKSFLCVWNVFSYE